MDFRPTFLLLAMLLSYSSVTCNRLYRDVLSTLQPKVNLSLTQPPINLDMPGVDPEANMNFCEIAEYHGYACEEYLHEVVTKDGFLLTLHRITGKKNGREFQGSRHPVFVQHGLLCDSTSWILNFPNQSLPFMLADAGFDVWLGNSRGNMYSRAHQTLKPDEDAFWAWSWDEMAQYDLPASIDFVLNHTGYDKLHYIGHSQGTLTAFIHLSEHESGKIIHMIALAPVFHMGNLIGPFKYVAENFNDIVDVMKILGLRDVLPNDWFVKEFADVTCNIHNPWHSLCEDIGKVAIGMDTAQLNVTRMPVYLNHIPSGTSIRNMMHFVQIYNSKNCTRFNYGSAEENILHYGTPYPPAYNLSSITRTPVTIYSGTKDWIADPEDVKYIIQNLKTLRKAVSIPTWDHLDFVWALDAAELLYDEVIQVIRQDFNY